MKAYIMGVPQREQSIKKIKSELRHIGFSEIIVSIDDKKRGPWSNLSSILKKISSSKENAIVFQDDVSIEIELLKKSLSKLTLLSRFCPVISLFTPPQKRFDSLKSQGYDALMSHKIFWVPCVFYRYDFASKILEANEDINQDKAGYHDELRISYALQKNKEMGLTLIGSFVEHRLDIKSTLGTPSKIGSVVRNTRIMAEKPIDVTDFNCHVDQKKTSYKEYLK